MKATGKIWIFFDAVTQKQTRPMSTVQAQLALLNLNVKDPQRFHIWTPGWAQWTSLQAYLETDQEYFVSPPSPAAASVPKPPPPMAPTPPQSAEDELSEKTVTKVFELDNTSVDTYTTVLENDGKAGAAKKAGGDNGYFMDDFSAEKIDPEAKHSLKFNLPGQQERKPDSGGRRSAERHHFKIEVILVNKHGRSFRTFSENISLGGTLLEDDLPKDFVNTQFDLILVNKFERDPAKGRLHFQGKIVGDYVNPRRLMFLDMDDHVQKRLEALLRSYLEHQKTARGKKKTG